MKWLQKRIVPIFKPEIEGKPDLMHQIVLNDPSQYEEIALAQGVQFVTSMFDLYEREREEFSLENYAAHFLEVKAKKFAQWRKYTCEICTE